MTASTAQTVGERLAAQEAAAAKTAALRIPGRYTITYASPAPTQPVIYFLIGAGGVGARIVPALTQMMRRGDVLHILDHDIVESRNLLRQHFAAGDVGKLKAEVLARRYAKEGITVHAYQTKLESDTQLQTIAKDHWGARTAPFHVIIGAVDTRLGRCAMLENWTRLGTAVPCAYIDVGNEMSGGQVLMNIAMWKAMSILDLHEGQIHEIGGGATIPLTTSALLPDLYSRSASERESSAPACADRIDLQTVVVNNMGATIALNHIYNLINGLPVASGGHFFSTLNSLTPIKLVRVPDAGWGFTGEPLHEG